MACPMGPWSWTHCSHFWYHIKYKHVLRQYLYHRFNQMLFGQNFYDKFNQILFKQDLHIRSRWIWLLLLFLMGKWCTKTWLAMHYNKMEGCWLCHIFWAAIQLLIKLKNENFDGYVAEQPWILIPPIAANQLMIWTLSEHAW